MKNNCFLLILYTLILFGCKQELPEATRINGVAKIFPDYNGVTIPPNIAPLNFRLKGSSEGIAILSNKKELIRLDSKNGTFEIPLKNWRKLLTESAGDSIQVKLYVRKGNQWICYDPFPIYVANDPIDSYLAYRLIAPGYRMWNEMGIYQRCVEDFDEDAVLSNKLTNNNCMNCHSFCMQNPKRMLFHQRTTHGGTYVVIDNKIEKLNTKTKETISALVYPSWHPSGKYVAFSTNETKQDFHLSGPNRVEVFDNESDVVFFDVEKQEIFSNPKLFTKGNYETFPTFSPDGKRLYFCSAPAKKMPEEFDQIKYNLLSIAFDPETRTFGNVIDTLYHADREGRSVKFPRVSPDGKYLLYTLSNYGNFSIWHKDADLRMLNLATQKVDSLQKVNSDDAESYHSWSSNSRWFVFSSRRIDGLYTRPYICYFDKNGVAGKPFLLPQKDTYYYDESLLSFNIPEFIKGKIKVDTNELVHVSKTDPGIDIPFVSR